MTEADQNLKELLENKDQFNIFTETSKNVKNFEKLQDQLKNLGIHRNPSIVDLDRNEGRNSVKPKKSQRNKLF